MDLVLQEALTGNIRIERLIKIMMSHINVWLKMNLSKNNLKIGTIQGLGITRRHYMNECESKNL